jgi:hypothetical protein
MKIFATTTIVACLLATSAMAAGLTATKPVRGHVIDVSDSGGGYFNGHPPAAFERHLDVYCVGGWERCGYDSAGNHTDASPR